MSFRRPNLARTANVDICFQGDNYRFVFKQDFSVLKRIELIRDVLATGIRRMHDAPNRKITPPSIMPKISLDEIPADVYEALTKLTSEFEGPSRDAIIDALKLIPVAASIDIQPAIAI